jgi:hypothetical protein
MPYNEPCGCAPTFAPEHIPPTCGRCGRSLVPGLACCGINTQTNSAAWEMKDKPSVWHDEAEGEYDQYLRPAEDWPRTFEDAFSVIYDQAFDILVERQTDYGSSNIDQQGVWGVYSRVAFDKISRLGNLIGGKIENGRMTSWFESEAGESIEDTCIDVMNYAAILIALKRGQWGLPLRKDHVKHG